MELLEGSENGAPDMGEGEDEGRAQEEREDGGAGNPIKWRMRLWGKEMHAELMPDSHVHIYVDLPNLC